MTAFQDTHNKFNKSLLRQLTEIIEHICEITKRLATMPFDFTI